MGDQGANTVQQDDRALASIGEVKHSEAQSTVRTQNSLYTRFSTETAAQQGQMDINILRKVLVKLGNIKRFETMVTLVTLVVCLLVSIPLYMLTQPDAGWTVLDCMYFSFVVITTVGYGDLLPTNVPSKMATIIFVHFALIVVSFLISNTINSVAETYVRLMQLEDYRLGVFNQQAERRMQRRRFWTLLFSYCMTLLAGTVYFSFRMPWTPEDGNVIVNSLYLTVVTVTTVGFGDYSPNATLDLKLFGMLLMFWGIPICVSLFSTLTGVVFGSSQDTRRLRILQGKFTMEKFEELNAFVEEMRIAGLGNYQEQGDGLISRFEYLVFMLSKNGLCDLDNVKAVMANFDAVDVTNQGFITTDDVNQYAALDLHLSVNKRGDSELISKIGAFVPERASSRSQLMSTTLKDTENSAGDPSSSKRLMMPTAFKDTESDAGDPTPDSRKDASPTQESTSRAPAVEIRALQAELKRARQQVAKVESGLAAARARCEMAL